MCGIVGGISLEQSVTQTLLSSLSRLEYRGYDSAGMAVLSGSPATLKRIRAVGKVANLIEAVEHQQLSSPVGIAHTRWATHGKPCEANAHPHVSHDRLALVHNGVLDNHHVLREKLQAAGYHFISETDTESLVHLLHQALTQHEQDHLAAIRASVAQCQGSYAFGLIDQQHPESLWAATHQSPLVIGIGESGHFLASDQLALIGMATHFIYLQSGQIAHLTAQTVTIFDAHGNTIQPEMQTLSLDWTQANLGEHRHYMHKEIFEQPRTLGLLGQTYCDAQGLSEILSAKRMPWFQSAKRLHIVACGSSYYAGLIGRFLMHSLAHLPCQVEIASEYRYSQPMVEAGTLFITISQSGETADTLAALRLAKAHPYLSTLTICNVAQSALVRESDHFISTLAGPEIGVASTKAFTAQVLCLQLLALSVAKHRGHLPAVIKQQEQQMPYLPEAMEQVLALEPAIITMAHRLADDDKALFIGRGWAYPVVLEGALKLKEISYIHAQAYPAGELKHGPLALVDHHMPVIACIPDQAVMTKTLSDCQTIAAREGRLILIIGHAVVLPESLQSASTIRLPDIPRYLQCLAMTVVFQLLAYHAAMFKGLDVDKPRNLAKSVTVE